MMEVAGGEVMAVAERDEAVGGTYVGVGARHHLGVEIVLEAVVVVDTEVIRHLATVGLEIVEVVVVVVGETIKVVEVAEAHSTAHGRAAIQGRVLGEEISSRATMDGPTEAQVDT